MTRILAAQPFIYDPNDPTAVPADLTQLGSRGYLFRLIDADGIYSPFSDPGGDPVFPQSVDGTTAIHWIDWKPITGENAWTILSRLKLYKIEYFDPTSNTYTNPNALELRLAIELARAALMLQDAGGNGGFRMAPIGTYSNQGSSWWYNQQSTENNASMRAAMRALYQITGDSRYKTAMDSQWQYFDAAWNATNKYFWQGMNQDSSGVWHQNTSAFAADCQTWPIIVLGPDAIDGRYGAGAAHQMWQVTKAKAGYFVGGVLRGIGYTTESDQSSPEWTRGAILACKALASYYASSHPDWAREVEGDINTMRDGLNDSRLTHPALGGMADSYSLKSEILPFGWNTLDARVDSITSTSWRVFDYGGINPFELSIARGRPNRLSLALLCAALIAVACGKQISRRGAARKAGHKGTGAEGRSCKSWLSGGRG